MNLEKGTTIDIKLLEIQPKIEFFGKHRNNISVTNNWISLG